MWLFWSSQRKDDNFCLIDVLQTTKVTTVPLHVYSLTHSSMTEAKSTSSSRQQGSTTETTSSAGGGAGGGAAGGASGPVAREEKQDSG